MPERTKLLAEIDKFLKAHAMAPTAFSRKAMGDSAFLFRLRADATRDVKASTIDRVRKWMTDYSREHKPARPTGGAGRAKRAA